MDYRLLGRSGLKVSTITMGTMTFGGVGWAKTVVTSASPMPAAWWTCASTTAST